MILFQYEKLGDSSLLPHLDTLRSIVRTLRRAEIAVRFSNGFNKHMLIHMGNPLPLGVESLAEFCVVDTQKDISAIEFLQRYNAHCPQSLRAIRACEIQKNPNLAGKSISAIYEITAKPIHLLSDIAHAIRMNPEYTIQYSKKGEMISVAVHDLIESIAVKDDKIIAELAFGNRNLRPDKLVENWVSQWGIDPFSVRIIKLQQNIQMNDQKIDTLTLLDNLNGGI